MKRSFSLFCLLFVVALGVFAQATAKVAIVFPDYGSLTEHERKAKEWLVTTYGTDNVSTKKPSELTGTLKDSYDVIWVMNDGSETISITGDNLTALTNFVKAGGNLVLTNMATPLVAQIGRIESKYEDMGTNNGDRGGVKGINPNVGSTYDHSGDALYSGVTSGEYGYGHNIVPLSNSYTYAKFWDMNETKYGLAANPNKIRDFENKTNSTVLGTWEHVEDFCCACIVRFNPTTDFQGTILACGMASYNWDETDKTYLDNIKAITKNMIDYQYDAYADYSKDGEGNLIKYVVEKPGGSDYTDGSMYILDLANHKAMLYDANHTNPIIRSCPSTVTYSSQPYDVVGIHPRVYDIPLKYVDLDHGGDNNRNNIYFNKDVPLNPHNYFNPYVIVYVCDRDFRYGDFATNGEADFDPQYNSGESRQDDSENICIASRVNVLKMQDKHPMMFPGKGAPNPGETYLEGHAFDVRKIIFERVFKPGITSTLILPFSLTEAEANAFGTFYDFTGYDSEKSQLNFTKHDFTKHDGATVARTPYIFLPKVAQMQVLEYADWASAKPVFRTIGDHAEEYDHSIDHDSYEFHGSFEFLKVYGRAHYNGTDDFFEYATMYGVGEESAKDLGIYAYNNGNFQTSSMWIGMRTFRCYIKLNQSGSGAKAASILASFADDTPASINLIDDEPKADDAIYNMMGQRIPSAQRGLYIVNGKKYFKK